MNDQNLLVHGIQNIDCSNHVSIKYKWKCLILFYIDLVAQSILAFIALFSIIYVL